MEGEAKKQEGDGRRTGVAAWRARKSNDTSFHFLSAVPSLSLPPSASSAQLAKQQVLSAAQQISSEERLKLFPFFSFLF